ncbi:hypothetical protein [Pseudomonas sp. PMCC200344]|uniref:hypothetical protein n=1 Tax=Pseudomonas sp. PMCC200344 TaxID=3042028 RepID=UPI0024B339FD|nr:hypothetical protein [Pseudomonas sp. PMCC200344]
MKLIIREYLAGLRERDELDALLPDLLSQMGLDVFSKPAVGGRQYGVDVAAIGSIDGGPETVYLFSVKSGDLGRTDWDGASPQSLRPSLNSIIDIYIGSHLPAPYRNKPIEICLCFGGNIKETVRLDVSSYINNNTRGNVSFGEWNGEKLANLIERYFLREDLLPEHCRQLLRKSIAILDEPDASYLNFKQLVHLLLSDKTSSTEELLTSLRQVYLCLWILFTWSRDQNNVESSYVASELCVLHSWERSKKLLTGTNKLHVSIQNTFAAIQQLHIQITTHYMSTSILPHTNNLHALSTAVFSSCSTDVNLKMFDVLGRLATLGMWNIWAFEKLTEEDRSSELGLSVVKSIRYLQSSMAGMIVNNPVLKTPCKDDQGIDIILAAWFLSFDFGIDIAVDDWLNQVINAAEYQLAIKNKYPCNLGEYYKLIEHPQKGESYFEEVTAGSILYPYLALLVALMGDEEGYNKIRYIKKEFLKHCNFQFWFPDASSEENFYDNNSSHGATLSHVSMETDGGIWGFLDMIFKECDESKSFNSLSAVELQHWPLIVIACRHYRYPVPLHFFSGMYVQLKNELPPV